MGDTSLGRYNRNPRIRVQKAENVNRALEFITSRGVKLTNIGPEDIIDGNIKLILGMIWTLILRFTIADISEEGLSAKEGLLLWCQRKTKPYDDVNVQDFSYSWQDDVHSFIAIGPDLIDYEKLDKTARHENTRLAFTVAAESLNIPPILEVEDLCDSTHPDERSVMTYIASFFHAFSTMDQEETIARRVEKFAELMQSVWVIRNDYERRMQLLLASIRSTLSSWASTTFTSSYSDTKALQSQFLAYKSTTKRIGTYGMRKYVPPEGLRLEDMEEWWGRLVGGERERGKRINEMIRGIKEELRIKFANLANDFSARLDALNRELAQLFGPLESQQTYIRDLSTTLIPSLTQRLEEVADAEAQGDEANVEENDHTPRIKSINAKAAFIENQIVSSKQTNLSPSQLETFESTLGIVYGEEDMDSIYEGLVEAFGAVSFEAFEGGIGGVARGKAYITELDLRQAHLPVQAIEYLKSAMPSEKTKEGNMQYDYARFIDEVFEDPEEGYDVDGGREERD
ncbi:calponin homology domain-containing protein [Panaeolus papilionaceus]|nr:calponin homology domain-containing protein [Panaeolus papilionaceus]